jgi:integrase
MLANGVPVKVASGRLGHSSTGITLDLYSHARPGMQEDVEMVARWLLAANTGWHKFQLNY